MCQTVIKRNSAMSFYRREKKSSENSGLSRRSSISTRSIKPPLRSWLSTLIGRVVRPLPVRNSLPPPGHPPLLNILILWQADTPLLPSGSRPCKLRGRFPQSPSNRPICGGARLSGSGMVAAKAAFPFRCVSIYLITTGTSTANCTSPYRRDCSARLKSKSMKRVHQRPPISRKNTNCLIAIDFPGIARC